MVAQEQENQLDVLEKAADDGEYKPVYPYPLPLRKKKKKKKKLFPTDSDDPETDDDFDDEDDDDDDSETGGSADPDTESENELKQEEIKPQSVFKNPFQFFMHRENMDLKKGPNPLKPQKSPIQKFFDVLLYGVEGARIRNGDLPKQNITDELLLGLGFKAYLKDVLLGRQAAKYWKQKVAGKNNSSLLKTGIKGLKKQAMNDPATKVLIKDLQKEVSVKIEQPKTTPQVQVTRKEILPQERQKTKQPEEVRVTQPIVEKVAHLKSVEQRKHELTGTEMKQILQRAETDEKRILATEKKNETEKIKQEEKSVLAEQHRLNDKQEQQRETHKNEQIQSAQKAVQQNDKDHLLMQKEELQMQKAQQGIDAMALQNAGRVAAMQTMRTIRNGLSTSPLANEMKDVVRAGMAPIDSQIMAAREQMRGLLKDRPSPISSPPPVPVALKESAQPIQSENTARAGAQPEQRQPDATSAIAERAVQVSQTPDQNVQVQLPERGIK